MLERVLRGGEGEKEMKEVRVVGCLVNGLFFDGLGDISSHHGYHPPRLWRRHGSIRKSAKLSLASQKYSVYYCPPLSLLPEKGNDQWTSDI